jgi:cystathionine gamma-synthase
MMSRHDAPHVLFREPRWRPEDLGQPLPPSPHANSVCLPTWADVIGYEQSDPRVISRLQTGYPRFFIHPVTERLFAEGVRRFCGPDEFCHIYPTRAAAERCIESVRRWTGLAGRCAAWAETGPFVTCFPREAADAAKKHWRHTGEGISSRQAEALLAGRPTDDAADVKRTICERIGKLAGVPADCVWLFGSGMSAIYTVYRAINRLTPDCRSVQFGFPYVDTLKIQQDLGPDAHFFPRGDRQELRHLEDLLHTEPVSAVYCEFPSNPLLVSPNLTSLAQLAQRHRFPLVVDETLGTFVNVDLRPVADVLLTSLTKYFTGVGDVLAGAAILNPCSALAGRLRSALEAEYEDTLWGDDARLVDQYSQDFAARVRRINRTAELVCEFCRSHPAVAEVYYPKFRTPDKYAAFLRTGGGYGGLFSLLLQNAAKTTPAFFDALQICKGPNLGTDFSLCCPFTLLAHFQELDWAERCGVSRYLVRVSVGLEEPRDLIARLEQALRGL